MLLSVFATSCPKYFPPNSFDKSTPVDTSTEINHNLSADYLAHKQSVLLTSLFSLRLLVSPLQLLPYLEQSDHHLCSLASELIIQLKLLSYPCFQTLALLWINPMLQS